MNLGLTWISKKGTSLVCPPNGRRVTSHRECRQIIDLAEPSGGENDRVSAMAFHRAGIHIAHNNPASLAVYHDQVEKFVPREELHRTRCHLTHQRLIGTKQKLLSGLTPGIECPRNLDPAKRSVAQISAVFAREWNSLGYRLVD